MAGLRQRPPVAMPRRKPKADAKAGVDQAALVARAAQLAAELAAVELKLKQHGHSIPIAAATQAVSSGNHATRQVEATCQSVPTTLINCLENCRTLALNIPVRDLLSLTATSRGCRAPLSSAACWRWLYSKAFPHEYPKVDEEPAHALSVAIWRRLYCDRQLDGAAAVPCFLHSPAGMASATLDPGAVRLVEAYLGRLCSQLAAMHGGLLQPPEEADRREGAMAEAARLLDHSGCATVCAAKMILKQLEASGRAFGCDGCTVWSIEQVCTSY